MHKFVLAFLLSVVSLSSFSAPYEATGVTTLSRFISYNQYGNGDVVFRVKNPSPTCHGYWITEKDPGFNANLSAVLAAYHAQSKVKIRAITDQEYKWAGSSYHWCKLYSIEYPEI